MTTPRFRHLGITDENTTCDRCNKVQLKNTVVIQPLDSDGNPEGGPLYYGSTCAAKALGIRGGGREVLRAARNAHWQAHSNARFARETLAAYGLPESGEIPHDAMRAAVPLYNRRNRYVAETCTRRGVKVPDLIREMVAPLQAHLAVAALLKIDVDAHLDY